MDQKIYKYIAQLFSFIFNPFIIPTIGFLIVFYSMPTTGMYSDRMRNILIGIVFISSFVMPIVFIMLLSALSSFNSYMAHHRDRILPYVFSAFSIFMGARLLSKLPIPSVFSTYMAGACITLIILFLVTIKWKISGHAAGMGGLIGMLIATMLKYGINLTIYLIAFIVIAGVVGSSRIYLEKHLPAQVYTGFIMSAGVLFLTVYYF